MKLLNNFFPDSDGNIVAASYNDFSACVQSFHKSDENAKYTIYRCVNPDNSTTYADVGK
jgi:hypothetical protein